MCGGPTVPPMFKGQLPFRYSSVIIERVWNFSYFERSLSFRDQRLTLYAAGLRIWAVRFAHLEELARLLV